MLIHSKINIFIRKFLLEHSKKDKKLIDKLLESWDSKKNQDLLKSRFIDKKSPKKKNVNKWNKFYKENYKKIKKELGEKATRKDIFAELSKRWKKEKEKPEVKETAIINFEPIVEFPELLIPPDSSLHRLLTEILKTGKQSDTPSELPTSPKSKKDLEEEEEDEDIGAKAYDSFCEANIDKIKENNPELTYDKITKILAKMWRELSQEEKDKWNT